MIGRELIMSGELVYQIGGRQRPVLMPAGSVYLTGDNMDPMDWWYQLTFYSPSNSQTIWEPGNSVLHFRINAPARRPWQGRSPFSWSFLSARLGAEVINAGIRESKVPSARILTGAPPEGAKSNPASRDTVKQNLAAAVQKGTGMAVYSDQEYELREMRAAPAQTLATLADQTGQDLLAAAGIPPPLADDKADGTTRRFAWQQFIFGTVGPIARRIEEELQLKLEMPVMLNFEGMASSESHQARSRSVKALVDAGFTKEQAARMVGYQPDN